MASRIRRTIEVTPAAAAFIRDLPRPPEGSYWEWLRMTLDLRSPKLFGPDNRLAQIWRSGGRDVVAELGITRAKTTLRCWRAFGDPRD